jgi:hypothetical protein
VTNALANREARTSVARELLHISTVIADWKADADYADLSLHDFIQLRRRVVPMEQRPPYIVQRAAAFKQGSAKK